MSGLSPGTRIGPYEITGELGAGGMGEVFRARDTRLQRDVAIKVLPELFASDPERLSRFEREATTLASLNHPNIAQIYGLEVAPAGPRALVMELVEGETLGERIARGAVPLDEALPIARQVADALEAAHDCGIIHRDLKPANIKVRPDGTVKVLDFGLAKALEPASAGRGFSPASEGNPGGPACALPNSPTFASPAVTEAGVILGTAAYMSPEQARGRAVDARADIWAFGVTLYEMLTGKPLFTGASVSDVLAAILRDDPKWELLPPETPPSVRTLLRRCLQKDPQQRLRHAGDARLELTDVDLTTAAAAPRRRVRITWLEAALLGVSVLGVTLLALQLLATRSTNAGDPALRKWIIPQQTGDNIWGRENIPAISPDGRRVAYTDGMHLRIRDLSSFEAAEVRGEGVAVMPTWSPDGSALAYFIDHKSLWQVPAAGGTPVKICDLPPGLVFGIAWRPNRTIVINMAYGPMGGELFRVSEGGGRPEKLAAAVQASDPAVFYLRGLPDGSLTYITVEGGNARTILEQVGKSPRTLEIPSHTGVMYAASGHLVYTARDLSGIWAVPFDLSAGSLRGEPFRIAESGVGPNVSRDGTLVYGHATPGLRQLTWFDRDGTMRDAFGQPQENIHSPAISPDGARVAVAGADKGVTNIWVHEVGRPVRSRITFGPNEADPAWHPRDGRLAFQSSNWDVLVANADGGTEPKPLLNKPVPEYQPLWSRDGRHLVYGQYSPKTQGDIWTIEAGGEARAVVEGAFSEMSPALSPDGRFVAYASDETGRNEIFMRAFPGGEGKRQVSSNGGNWPRWSGNEIFFVEAATLMAATVRTDPSLQVDAPKPLFKLEDRAALARVYDTADGRRFVIARTLRQPQNAIAVVQNWLAEFKQ